MFKMKKLLSMVLAVGMIATTGTTALAQNENYNQVEISEYYLGNRPTLYSNQDVLLHNNGKPIDTNIFVDGQNEGNELIGVYQSGSGLYNHYFFTQNDDSTKNTLLELVDANVNPTTSRSGYATDKFTWEFSNSSTITSTVEMERTNQGDIGGVPGSTWNVMTYTELDKQDAQWLYGLITRLDAAGNDILSYSPYDSGTEGGVDVAFGASAASGPDASIEVSFPIDGFNFHDHSSLRDNYARWEFDQGLVAVAWHNRLVTQGAIRATNTDSTFIAQLSHRAHLSYGYNSSKDFLTGVVQVWGHD